MTIFDSGYGKVVDLKAQAKSALDFLIRNQKLITFDDVVLADLKMVRGHGALAITDLFHQLITDRGFADFVVLDVSSVKDGVPDVLTVDAYSIDGASLADLAPASLQKQWINLTPMVKKRSTPNQSLRERISDIPRVCKLFVRGGFCRGYQTACDHNKDWLSMNHSKFVVESYSMSVAKLAQRLYNLDYLDMMMVGMIFGFFYANRMGRTIPIGEIPPILNHCSTLGNPADIKDAVSMIGMQFPEGTDLNRLGISELCSAIPKLGAGRLADFSFGSFRQMFTQSPYNSFEMSFALDYPPYWVTELLLFAGRAPNGVLNNAMSMPVLKRQLQTFVKEIGRHARLFGE